MNTNTVNISYGITVCNEIQETKRLVEFLHSNKREQDEIVLLLDSPKVPEELRDWLYRYSSANWIKLIESKFEGHFADWKNKLNSKCSGDYIFQIDADEMPSRILIEHLPYVLTETTKVDVILVPRINTVEGITKEHIEKWGWNINEKGWINYPDLQMRIYRNIPEIKWKNKVHEVLEGHKIYSVFPVEDEEFVLYHPKTISKQEKQNSYYNSM